LLATSIPPCICFHSSYKDILFGSGAFNNLFAIVGNFRCNNGEFCLQFRPISFCNNHVGNSVSTTGTVTVQVGITALSIVIAFLAGFKQTSAIAFISSVGDSIFNSKGSSSSSNSSTTTSAKKNA